MFIVEFLKEDNKTKELYNPCGSDYTTIIRDLKTIKGVKNRLKGYSREGIKQINIYSVTNIYNRNTYVLKDTIQLI